MVMLWQEATLYPITPGCGGWGTGWHPGLPGPSDSFIFGLPFPIDSTNSGMGLLSVFTTSLKRSASSVWSINLAVSWDVVEGALPITSNRSVSSQLGPPCTLTG